MPLFWRIFLLNAAVLVAAVVLLLVAPVTVSAPALAAEAAVLAAALAVVLVMNALLLRVGLAPLQRLSRAMATADLLRPGRRPRVRGHGEVAELIAAFNAMLDRLEAERAAGADAALSAQEAERQRVARELHDEVGQTLTAVLLELTGVTARAPQELRGELGRVQEATRDGLEEVRRIARRLRPGVLEELGLAPALTALAAEYSTGGLTVRRRVDPGLPALPHDVELVLYRVAQESLTNTARHAGAHTAEVTLRRVAEGVELAVTDDGRGPGPAGDDAPPALPRRPAAARTQEAPAGPPAGVRGMRERAVLVGGDLAVRPVPGGGTRVRLLVPVAGAPGTAGAA